MALAQRFNTNTQAQNGTDTGVHLSMNDIVPIQPISKGTSSDDEKVTVQQLQSIPYGIGNLSGTTYNVTLLNYPADYTLRVGSKMLVKFASAKSGTTVLNLAINGQTIPMQMQGSALTEIFANQILEFTFVGTIASGIHTITHANASAGISASQLNGALANYDTKGNQSVIAKTDANLCIPNEQTESINYIAYGSNKNLPTNDASYFIRTQRSSSYIVQFASNVQNALTKTEPDYTRKAKLSGETWTFSPWEKITTESALNTTLSSYRYSGAKELKTTDDLNTLLDEGLYFCNGYVLPANVPVDSAVDMHNCMIEVLKQGNTDRYVQKFYTLNGEAIYIRRYGIGTSTSWSNWQKITTQTDLNTTLKDYQRVYTLTRGETNNPTLKITDTGNTRPTSILIYGFNGLNIIQFTTSVETGSIKTIYGAQLVNYDTETHEITVSQVNRQVTILLPENKKVVSQTN